MTKKITLGLIGLMLSATAFASDIYVLGTVGTTKIQTKAADLGVQNFDEKDTGYSIGVGYKFHKNFAVEASLNELGKFNFSDPLGEGHITVRSKDVAIVGSYELCDNWNVTAKAGVSFMKTSFPGGFDNRTTSLFGVGLDYKLTNKVDVIGDVTQYTKTPGVDTRSDVWRVGLKYNF